MKIMAELGVGILIIPQKPWREVDKELTEYNTLYREINGIDPPHPISAGWTFCDPERRAGAREGEEIDRRVLPHRARPLPLWRDT